MVLLSTFDVFAFALSAIAIRICFGTTLFAAFLRKCVFILRILQFCTDIYYKRRFTREKKDSAVSLCSHGNSFPFPVASPIAVDFFIDYHCLSASIRGRIDSPAEVSQSGRVRAQFAGWWVRRFYDWSHLQRCSQSSCSNALQHSTEWY